MNTITDEKMSRSFAAIKKSMLYHLKYTMGKELKQATRHDIFMAVSHAVRDRIIDGLIETENRYQREDSKRVYYLSIEFLMGRLLGNNMHNLCIFETCEKILSGMDIDLINIIENEADAALGNGGLGRLAACFLDSMATIGIPGYGYGINYEFGLFKQVILDGQQREKPDHWLCNESPWLIERQEDACIIPVYGKVRKEQDISGSYNHTWTGWKTLIGIPYDMPIVGYGGNTVNFLRLFSARASDEFDIQIFNDGDYLSAVEDKVTSEAVSKILYPSDSGDSGKELRLLQEYFLVACAVKDILRRFLRDHDRFDIFPEKVAIQLNDTHPALTVTELMRTLLDDHGLGWGKAWKITKATLAYTNHTLLPEALEKWSVPLMERVLPRHLQIIYQINHIFLKETTHIWSGNIDEMRAMSIIEESQPKHVNMANLSIIGSHSTNGVSALHSELVKKSLVPHFHRLWPEKFNNKTNGVTQRRWLLKCNPLLASLLNKKIGDKWITDLEHLRKIEEFVDDRKFQTRFMEIKKANKERLTKIISDTTGITVDPGSLFDVQAKRIHEYKRQLLNVMHIIHEYLCIIEDGVTPAIAKTYIFAGKAAPGYWAAKQIIKLINNVGRVINKDSKVKGLIKVVFIPDYRVSLAEKIITAADLSEQISTAGKEASGTGNMKFAMNGAITIGTLDGANIEIKEEVGDENIYIFGHTAEEIQNMRDQNSYTPKDYYNKNMHMKRVMDALNSDLFCPEKKDRFKWIYHAILDHGDGYFHLADLQAYNDTHDKAARDYQNHSKWARMAILNIARTGKFSSDRTIREYARDIWDVKPCL